MVGFHVLHYKVIGLFAVQHGLNVIYPFLDEIDVHRVHNCGFFIAYNVRIVAHSVGYRIHTLKQIDIVIVDADVFYIIRNKHFFTNSFYFIFVYFIAK